MLESDNIILFLLSLLCSLRVVVRVGINAQTIKHLVGVAADFIQLLEIHRS